MGKDSRESRAGARIFLCSLDPVKEKEKGEKKRKTEESSRPSIGELLFSLRSVGGKNF